MTKIVSHVWKYKFLLLYCNDLTYIPRKLYGYHKAKKTHNTTSMWKRVHHAKGWTLSRNEWTVWHPDDEQCALHFMGFNPFRLYINWRALENARARAFVISAVVVPVLSDSRRWQLFSFRGWQTEFITEKTGSFFFTLKALFEKEKALAVEALENYPQ